MRIRSMTCFTNPNQPGFGRKLQQLKDLSNFCKEEIKKTGWEVQTARLATTSFGLYSTPANRIDRIRELEEESADAGFNYLSIGPARLTHPDEYEVIPEILANTENVFVNAFLSHHAKGISMPAVRACAKVIIENARISPDGFTNLRFCAMSRVEPFTPFFPAAYCYGRQPAFSFAVECADAAVAAFAGAKTLAEARKILLSALENASEDLSAIAGKAAIQFGIVFKGFDFSPAPFPEDWCSLGYAMEKFGVRLGNFGALTSAAAIAETLDRGSWPRCGFNGLMLPVLEDSRLAKRSGDAAFTLKDLLLYSAVCGTGLDTVPLPGDTPAELIEPLLADIAALSLRLRKPLTARLMPVPGVKAGELTRFDFEFFRNGTVLDLTSGSLTGLLEKAEWVEIRKRDYRS